MALVTAMFIQTPNTSLFPEIDIASKIVTEDGYEPHPFLAASSFTQLLWPLSNAGSVEIRRRLAATRFFVRLSDKDVEGNRRVVLILQENGMPLGKGVEEGSIDENTEFRTGEDNPFQSDKDKGCRAIKNATYQAQPMEEEIRTVPYIPRTPPSPQMSSRYL